MNPGSRCWWTAKTQAREYAATISWEENWIWTSIKMWARVSTRTMCFRISRAISRAYALPRRRSWARNVLCGTARGPLRAHSGAKTTAAASTRLWPSTRDRPAWPLFSVPAASVSRTAFSSPLSAPRPKEKTWVSPTAKVPLPQNHPGTHPVITSFFTPVDFVVTVNDRMGFGTQSCSICWCWKGRR